MKNIQLTEGPILGRLVRFALPMMLGNLLQQIYNLVDTLIVGRYLGPDALAAVGSCYALMVFLNSVLIGLCMGSGALFSANYGAGNHRQLREDIELSFVFVFAVTVIMYLVIYPGMSFIQSLLQVPAALQQMTIEYVSVVFLGIFFIFIFNFFAYLLRAMGNAQLPLYFLLISSVVNIILDVWFVIGLQMGVAGVAWATVIAQVISSLGITVYSIRKLPLLQKNAAERRSRQDRRRRMGEIVRNDIMTGMQQSVMNFGILMIQGLVNSFGPVIMAAFAAAVKIDTIGYMPAQEFGNAYSLFISQNYGAGKAERIREGTRKAMACTILFCLCVSLLIWIFAGSLMRIFIAPEETAILAEGVRYLRIEGAMYVGIGILFLWYGYFRGGGRPHISLVLTIISLGTRVLLSYALAHQTSLGVVIIWLSIPIGWFMADAAGLLFYRQKKGSHGEMERGR